MVTGRQKAAIAAYTGVGYERINGALRNGNHPKIPHISQLDAAIAEATLGKELVVYRGIGSDFASVLENSGLYLGTELTDPAFLSTSRNLDEAIKFSASEKGGMVMQITVPCGASALDIAAYSNCPEEEEVLLARGSRLKVVGFDADRGLIEMELIHESS